MNMQCVKQCGCNLHSMVHGAYMQSYTACTLQLHCMYTPLCSKVNQQMFVAINVSGSPHWSLTFSTESGVASRVFISVIATNNLSYSIIVIII